MAVVGQREVEELVQLFGRVVGEECGSGAGAGLLEAMAVEFGWGVGVGCADEGEYGLCDCG